MSTNAAQATSQTSAVPAFSAEAIAERIAKTTHQAIHQAVTAALRSIPSADDSTADEPSELDDIAQDAAMQGKRYARCWDLVQGTDEFRNMPIVDYRDGTAAWAWGVMTDAGMFAGTPEGRFVFVSCFCEAFDDEALRLAEDGAEGFEDVAEAGSVDGSIIVTLRRTLADLDFINKEHESVLIWQSKAMQREREAEITQRLNELKAEATAQ